MAIHRNTKKNEAEVDPVPCHHHIIPPPPPPHPPRHHHQKEENNEVQVQVKVVVTVIVGGHLHHKKEENNEAQAKVEEVVVNHDLLHQKPKNTKNYEEIEVVVTHDLPHLNHIHQKINKQAANHDHLLGLDQIHHLQPEIEKGLHHRIDQHHLKEEEE
jgi:hypothetical protein